MECWYGACDEPGKGGGPSLNCDPMSPYDSKDQGCHEKDCASDVWRDGCRACMCYNNGNASWCDRTNSAYYDNYYEEHGKNPFGDSKYSNKKCNTDFSQQDASCRWDWECESGAGCCLVYNSASKKRYCNTGEIDCQWGTDDN